MKKVLPLLALLILLSVPAYAFSSADVQTLPIVIGRQGVTEVFLEYEVDSVVTDVSVACNASNIYSSYFDEETSLLRIALASAYVVDTSEPLFTVSAKITDGSALKSHLHITKMEINGEEATTNISAATLTATKSGSSVSVSATATDDLNGSVWGSVAVYDASGKLLGVSWQEVDLSQGSASINLSFAGCSTAATVKLFLMEKGSYAPACAALSATVA